MPLGGTSFLDEEPMAHKAPAMGKMPLIQINMDVMANHSDMASEWTS